ncbi:hypothetical protein TcBrA4_0005720 [Trypanosoma cruzi]|nr:hypothetical protein TcBrA4_0005720 [Trypanosoma cruzi]
MWAAQEAAGAVGVQLRPGDAMHWDDGGAGGGGLQRIKSRHDKTNEELADLRLQVHQEYLEAFRRLYKTLGQLVYKKEKRLEEIDRNIRTTHIQLEFAIETFDPNAKKHSDAKKELYKLRAQVEEELEMLKDKMAQRWRCLARPRTR